MFKTLVLVALSSVLLMHPSAAQLPVPPGSLDLQGQLLELTPEHLLVLHFEGGASDADLNGDGDKQDYVVSLRHHGSGRSQLFPVAISQVHWLRDPSTGEFSRYIALYVRESDHSVDLNGDGDLADEGAMLIDVRFRKLIKLPFAVKMSSIRFSGDSIAFSVSEAQQAAADLNGDGDASDFVVHVHDLKSQVTTNVGIASGGFSLDVRATGSGFAVLVWEFAQGGIDLGGDGLVSGNVMHLVSQAGLATNTGIAPLGHVVVGDAIVLAGSESFSGEDFDGDGVVSTNKALLLLDVETGNADYLGVSDLLLGLGTFTTSTIAPYAYTQFDGEILRVNTLDGTLATVDSMPVPVGEDLAVVYVPESGVSDLNGDGDFGDVVIHLADVETQTPATNLGVSTQPIFNQPVAKGADGVVVTTISEKSQGNRDRNLDGDTKDFTLLVHHVASGQNHEVPLGVVQFETSSGLVAFLVSEAGNGSANLNHDGDAKDHVLHVMNVRTGQLMNLKAGTASFQLVGRRLAWTVSEQDEGGSDFNGDGDSLDLFVHMLEL